MTQDNSHLTILDRLVAVNLSISIWSARKKLTAADFGNASLPPEELASLGSKKICDPERLRIFSTLKSRAVSRLDSLGVRFLGGWAIPEERATEVHGLLLKLRDEFLLAKDAFLSSYDQAIQDWVDKHPGWEKLIADSPVSADQVRRRLGFNWQLYKVAAPDSRDGASKNLLTELETLGQTLFGEVASEARNIWHKVYAGRTEVSHKALSSLRNLHRKLAGLSFVEPRVAPVADLIEAALPLDSPVEMVNLARAFIDHEAAHIRDTDLKQVKKANLTPLEHHLWNIIEDWRVEKVLGDKYPGCRLTSNGSSAIFSFRPQPIMKIRRPILICWTGCF